MGRAVRERAPISCVQVGREAEGAHATGADSDNLHGDATSLTSRTLDRSIPGTRQPTRAECSCRLGPAALPSSRHLPPYKSLLI